MFKYLDSKFFFYGVLCLIIVFAFLNGSCTKERGPDPKLNQLVAVTDTPFFEKPRNVLVNESFEDPGNWNFYNVYKIDSNVISATPFLDAGSLKLFAKADSMKGQGARLDLSHINPDSLLCFEINFSKFLSGTGEVYYNLYASLNITINGRMWYLYKESEIINLSGKNLHLKLNLDSYSATCFIDTIERSTYVESYSFPDSTNSIYFSVNPSHMDMHGYSDAEMIVNHMVIYTIEN